MQSQKHLPAWHQRLAATSVLLLAACSSSVPLLPGRPAGMSAAGTAASTAASPTASPTANPTGAAGPAPDSARAEAPPAAQPCPSGLPGHSRCLAGTDSAGAHYLIALPPAWSGVLVLHAHGGPELGAPRAERTAQDLQRWAVVLRAGHAWAGSTYRQGGVAVHAAAADTERLRRIFVQHIAQPKRTVLHGQSWGASVAATGADLFGRALGSGNTARPPYDAVLLTSGVLGGGSRSYDFRLDLRVVYQHLCGNHPRVDEPAYPLWMGLPPGNPLTHAALAARVDACLGLRQPSALRTASQQHKLQTLLAVIRVPESALLGHLNWATWHFQDIVQQRTGGANPFGNIGAVYSGSGDDAALNQAVLRYPADPRAVATLAADTDPTGRITVPVLALHAVFDPVAFVELESTWRDTMAQAGTSGHLVQAFTSDASHSYLTDAAYLSALPALLDWVDGGAAPTPASLASRCAALPPEQASGCRFLPSYQPAPLASRVAPRQRP